MKSLDKPSRKLHKQHILSKKAKVKATPEKKEITRQRASANKGKKGQNENKYFR